MRQGQENQLYMGNLGMENEIVGQQISKYGGYEYDDNGKKCHVYQNNDDMINNANIIKSLTPNQTMPFSSILSTPIRMKSFSCEKYSTDPHTFLDNSSPKMISRKIQWQQANSSSYSPCNKSKYIQKSLLICLPRRDRFGRTIFTYQKRKENKKKGMKKYQGEQGEQKVEKDWIMRKCSQK